MSEKYLFRAHYTWKSQVSNLITHNQLIITSQYKYVISQGILDHSKSDQLTDIHCTIISLFVWTSSECVVWKEQTTTNFPFDVPVRQAIIIPGLDYIGRISAGNAFPILENASKGRAKSGVEEGPKGPSYLPLPSYRPAAIFGHAVIIGWVDTQVVCVLL